jgi:hypothetical protein
MHANTESVNITTHLNEGAKEGNLMRQVNETKVTVIMVQNDIFLKWNRR